MLCLQRTALANTVTRRETQWLVSGAQGWSRLQKRNISISQLDAQKDNRERVVILGSGWAGYTLSMELNPKKYQVVVVSPRSYFVFTPCKSVAYDICESR